MNRLSDARCPCYLTPACLAGCGATRPRPPTLTPTPAAGARLRLLMWAWLDGGAPACREGCGGLSQVGYAPHYRALEVLSGAQLWAWLDVGAPAWRGGCGDLSQVAYAPHFRAFDHAFRLPSSPVLVKALVLTSIRPIVPERIAHRRASPLPRLRCLPRALLGWFGRRRHGVLVLPGRLPLAGGRRSGAMPPDAGALRRRDGLSRPAVHRELGRRPASRVAGLREGDHAPCCGEGNAKNGDRPI